MRFVRAIPGIGALPDAIRRMKATGAGAEPRLLNVIADRSFSAQRFLDVVDGLRQGGVPVRIITINQKSSALLNGGCAG